MNPTHVVAETVDTALGRAHRRDPVLPRTGGPAGNARVTAWLGILLLVMLVPELLTLLALDQLITWHIAIGAAVAPPALVKTGTTGWRMARYYSGSRVYRTAGPPPLILRVLGPLVVVTTLALLASGIALIAVGSTAGLDPMFSVLGHAVSPLTIHQACFIVWAVATGLHVLGRLVPAVRIAATHVSGRAGAAARWVMLAATAAASGAAAVAILVYSNSWTSGAWQHWHQWRH